MTLVSLLDWKEHFKSLLMDYGLVLLIMINNYDYDNEDEEIQDG